MATLKNLVHETTNIKNELVECHSNLKNNLIEKGVECSDTDKMSSLIDKVNNITTINMPKHFPTEDIWVTRDIDLPVTATNTFVVNDTMYIMHQKALNKPVIYKYSMEEDVFIYETTAPTERSSAFIGVYGDSLYILGGINNSSRKKTNESYNFITKEWTTNANMPIHLSNSTVIVKDDNIHFICGVGGSSSSATNSIKTHYTYNITTDTYTTRSNGPFADNYPACYNNDNELAYMISSSAFKSYDLEAEVWTSLTMSNTKKSVSNIIYYNGFIYIFHNLTNTGNTEIYDINSDTWAYKSRQHAGFSVYSSVLYNDHMHFFGKVTDETQELHRCYIF